MRKLILASAVLLPLAACGTTSKLASTAVPVAAVTDAQTALATYQAALGVAQVALISNPSLLAKVNTLTAQAAPYVAAVQTGVADAAAAPTLGALAAQLLDEGAAYIRAIPAR